ncbi:papain-like cysteine protease family protein [Roseibium album]|uniref:papain-like cysteine protease family protein n=1 Tax=Roseibium album TaxID=311410 RepID=UPI00391BC381
MKLKQVAQHNVPLIPQPTKATCWAAAIAMLKGKTITEIVETTPRELINPNGGLQNHSGSSDIVEETKKFAAAHNLKYSIQQCWTLPVLHAQLMKGPMAHSFINSISDYFSNDGGTGHMIVMTGVEPTKNGMSITFNDPSPVGKGMIATVDYHKFEKIVPTISYRAFWM